MLARLAPQLLARATAAVALLAKPQEALASEAARVPEVGAGFTNQVDAATFQDLMETEEEWRPFRERGQVSALFSDGHPIASLFPDKVVPRADAILERAAKSGAASGLAEGRGHIFRLGAARIEKPEKAKAAHALVLVGQALDGSTLAGAADPMGGTLALSNGTELLLSGGPGDAQRTLALLVGREETTPFLTEGRLLAAASPIAPGLWLWAVGSGPIPLAPNPLPFALGAAAALLFSVGVWLQVRGRRRPARDGADELDDPAAGVDPTRDSVAGPILQALARGQAAPGLMSRGFGEPTAMPRNERPRGTLPQMSGTPSASAQAAQSAAETPKVDTGSDLQKRYTLLEKIGEGGMAEVFRATLHGAEGFERQLVVKRLHARFASDKGAVSQFIDEARLQSGLSHANIVPVLDFGRAGPDYFLVLEYVRGRDLDKVVQRFRARFGRALDLPLAAYILGEVLNALGHAHEKTDAEGRSLEIVHRDVSVGNVLISYQGEVKLSDFGIVKAERRVAQTEVGVIKGNPAFMAPEQARGEPVDLRADLFSVGAVLYWCLRGQPLYEGEPGMNQLLRAAVGPATAQHLSIDGLGADVAPILARALAPRPEGRFSSAAELARALRPIAGATSREDMALLMRNLFAEEMQRER